MVRKLIPMFLLVLLSEALFAQSTRGRSFEREKPTMMVQAGVGIPELYGIGLGFISETRWIVSLVGNGVLILGSDDIGKGIGLQMGKLFGKRGVFIVQPSILQTPKGKGDGGALSFYVGFANTQRVGSSLHGYLGWTMISARGYVPSYALSFKLGINYNLASFD
jgi:hypothetical protein